MYAKKPPEGVLSLVELGLIYRSNDSLDEDEEIFYFDVKSTYFTYEMFYQIRSLFDCNDVELNVDISKDIVTMRIYLHYMKEKSNSDV